MGALLMNWKSTATVSGVTLLATWLGWTPARQPSVTDSPAVSADVAPLDADIEQQAARLQMRVRSELGYQDPKRNPFRFIVRSTPNPPQPPANEVIVPSPQIAVPDLLPFTLSGMATDRVEGRTVRTAILTTATEVLFVKEGDRVGAYTVSGVDETGINLTADDGGIRRLPLIP